MRRLIGPIGTVLALGVLAQTLAFAAGIVAIRSMSRLDYAAYSICIAITSAVAVISDSGIGSRLIADAAAVNADRARASQIFAAALRARRAVWLVTMVPALGLLIYLLARSGFGWLFIAACCALVASGSFINLSISISSIEHQLGSKHAALQARGILSNAVRLALGLLAAVARAASSLVFLSISTLAALIQSMLMRRSMRSRVDDAKPQASDVRRFNAAIRSAVAASLVLILGEQWQNVVLVSHANSVAIADIAALNRFATAFALVNIVFGNLAAPWVARTENTRLALRRASSAVITPYVVIAIAYVAGLWLFAGPVLAILGSRYEALSVELVIIGAGSALANLSNYGIGIIIHARGWVATNWLFIPFAVVWAIVGLVAPGVGTTFGGCVYAATFALPVFLAALLRLIIGYRQVPSEPPTYPEQGLQPGEN